jgi:rare lipoprotein A
MQLAQLSRVVCQLEFCLSSKLTAAHGILPFGRMVRATNLVNGRTTVVRINDRGLSVKNRLIDLSQVAAQQLQFSGFVPVSLEIVRTHE